MKRLILMFALLLPVLAAAQNETLISKDEMYKSHMNLEFYTSTNAYFTENSCLVFTVKALKLFAAQAMRAANTIRASSPPPSSMPFKLPWSAKFPVRSL